MAQSLAETLQGALARQPEAARELVDALYPIVQARVARVLWRARGSNSTVRQEVEDLVQEVFALLFEEEGRLLRSWDGARGLSLPNFVGLVAERRTIGFLRSARQNHFAEDSSLIGALEAERDPAPGPEPAAFSRELLAALLDRLRLALSPLGMHLFELVYVEERTVQEVVELAGMSTDAVYAWRSRLRKLVLELAAELIPENTPLPAPAPEEVSRHER